MFKKVVIFCLGCLAIFAFGACPDKKDDGGEHPQTVKKDSSPKVAEFVDGSISLDEFEKRITHAQDPDTYPKILHSMVTEELLYQEGLNRELDRDEKIIETLNSYKRQLVLTAIRSKLQKPPNEFTETEIEAYYKSHIDDYDAVSLRQIFVRSQQLPKSEEESGPPEEFEAKAREKIESIYARAKAGEDFGKLAKEVNAGKLKETGGLVGPWTRKQIAGRKSSNPVYAAAAAFTEVGQMSEIIETPIGFYMLKLESIETLPLNKQLSVRIQRQLARDHYQSVIDEMRSKSNLVIHSDVLKDAKPSRKVPQRFMQNRTGAKSIDPRGPVSGQGNVKRPGMKLNSRPAGSGDKVRPVIDPSQPPNPPGGTTQQFKR